MTRLASSSIEFSRLGICIQLGNSSSQPSLLNVLPEEEFFARQADVQRLFHAGLDVARGLQSSCFLSGPRKSGKTEILKRAYNRLFWEQDAVIPFFHALPKSITSAEVFCREYFLSSALQCIGFLRKDARLLISEEHDLNRIVQLAYESKLSWLTDAFDHFHQFTKNKDLQALSRLAILFPSSVAARTGLYAFVFVDNFHHLSSLAAPVEMSLLTAHFLQALESRQAPHCLAGASKPLFQSLFRTAELPGCVEVMPLRSLQAAEAKELLERLCHRFDVGLEAELSHFIVRQLDCNPFYIRSMLQTARRESTGLSSARQFAGLYSSELVEGSLQLYFSSLLHSAQLNAIERIKALEFLRFCAHAPLEFAALHYLKGREMSEGVDFEAVLNALAALGLIDYSFGVVSALQDPVLRDWVEWNFSHKVAGTELSRVHFDLSSGLLKKFGQALQSRQQTDVLASMKAVLQAMNCQSVPRAWLSYAEFVRSKEFGGAAKQPALHEGEVVLPEVISLTVLSSVSSPGGDFLGGLVIARGFERGLYSDDMETAWLAGFVTGAAGLDEVQRFYRRCEVTGRQEGLKRAQLWLVAEERFNQAALSFAEAQGIFSSNLEQLKLLAHEVVMEQEPVQEPEEAEALLTYEMTIPMSADSELVAVRALEQIADSSAFNEKSKGQVRMALMEACINIKEAVASEAGRIHLSFKTASHRLVVHLRAEGRIGAETDPVQAWGMKMLRTLMDDVRLRRTAQGFELVMTKHLPAAANAKSEAV